MRDLSICGTCRQLKGQWQDDEEDPIRVQRCGCDGVDEERWPGFDFNRIAELCRCCTLVPLRSGWRFSVWFCEPCRERAVALNRQVGSPVVPIGRHSMMHGIGVPGDRARDPGVVEGIVAAVQDVFAAQRALERWARRRLEDNLALLGRADGDVPVAEYLADAGDVAPGSADSFQDLLAWLRVVATHHGDVVACGEPIG